MNLRKQIGNLLIIIAIGLLAYTYYPVLKSYFVPIDPRVVLKDSRYNIQIPKINAYAPIIPNVDPFNATEYKAALKHGVAEAKGFNNFLFAHSSDEPWNITKYNTAFFRLGELKSGDSIYIYKEGARLTYQVKETKTVWPNEVGYLTSKSNQLILQTCTPVGTSLKRLLVFADLIP